MGSCRALTDANSGIFSLSSDGNVDWPRTLRLARFAHQDGVRKAVTTTDLSCLEILVRRWPQLTALLDQHQVAIELTASVEFSLTSDLFDQVAEVKERLGGIHRRFVFLRVPHDTQLPVTPVIESLRQMGLTAVLVAPERCACFRNDVSLVKRVVECGGTIQLSAASLLDQTDRSRVRYCRQLVRQGLCHFVATESGTHHDMPISLTEAHALIARWAGAETANAICGLNANQLLAAESLAPLPKRSGMFSVLRRAA